MDRTKIISHPLFLFTVILSVFCWGCVQAQYKISLAGEWTVKLDSLDAGEAEQWQFDNLAGTLIELPATLDDLGIGYPSTLKPALNNNVLSSLSRKREYYGKAWYQKTISIPDNWADKEIHLKIERVLWQSKVYINEKFAGSRESLIGSHDYNLTELLNPGDHQITIVIDNSNRYPFINVLGNRYPDDEDKEMAHAYTNHTQIKWNGMLGEISLTAKNENIPSDLQIFPNLNTKTIEIQFTQDHPQTKSIEFQLLEKGKVLHAQRIDNAKANEEHVTFQIDQPENLENWDEFNPVVYEARLIIGKDTIRSDFGNRKISYRHGQLLINGHRIYLRGNLECVIFPLRGTPPMEKEGWQKIFRQAKNYGFNHIRFHSWCPPKSAFQVADEMGVYLQVELPHWSLKVGEDEETIEFLNSEADKILKDYGNHPSFVLMSMGNELQGDINALNEMVAKLKSQDNRHLYTTTTFSFQEPTGLRPEPEDEFFVTQRTEKGWIRGQGIFNDKTPRFDEDYSQNIDHIDLPLVSHEIGQYSVYPDLSEIPKYTGVLEPLNFIAIKNDLQNKGLLDLADDFTNASGKLAAILYKEEIERALKTPGFDGFQLLQLQDFPGQGTALVGLLNAFWETKGIISGKAFKQFNSEVVPLIRFKKAVYSSGEYFRAKVEIANFYKDFKDKKVIWLIKDGKGAVLKKDSVLVNLPIGNNTEIASIDLLLQVEKADQLEVTVIIEDTDYKNSWSIWVYPKLPIVEPEGILITTSFEEANQALEKGKKVLLNPNIDEISGVKGRFVPVFWSPVHFPDQPGTMGLLIDKEHLALKDFPTSKHAEWNWWDLCIHSKSVILDGTGITPIVRVIDNFVTNRRLANVFEAKVSKGSLLFTSIDLQNNLEKRPVAKQLLFSLLKYMSSNSFHPSNEMSLEFLTKLKTIKKKESAVIGPGVDYLADFKQQLNLKWPNNKTMNVVFHGHSVPAGYFKTPMVNTLEAYPHLFLQFLKKNYRNAVINCIITAIGGEQSEQGVQRFKQDVLNLKPDLLFIDYALNDRRIGLKRAEVSWRSMINQALAAEVKIVLLTPTPDLKENILNETANLAGYADMIRRLGSEYQVPVVDVYDQFKALKSSGTDLLKYMSQENHPNELGHQVVLSEIVSTLFN